MFSDKIYRLAILVLAVSLCLSTTYFAFALVGAWAENEKLLKSETELVRQIDALSKERQYKEEYFYRLMHDKSFKERIIREKLGYVGKRELVFRFDDSIKAPDDTNTKVSSSATAGGSSTSTNSAHSLSNTGSKPVEEPKKISSASDVNTGGQSAELSAGGARLQSLDVSAGASATDKISNPDIERAVKISEKNILNSEGRNSSEGRKIIRFRTVGGE